MRHTLKCWPESFADLWGGKKSYEIRNDDRNFKVGDSLQIMEWVPLSPEGPRPPPGFTGRVLGADIIHVTHGGRWGLPVGICVMQLQVFARDVWDPTPKEGDPRIIPY